MSRTWGARPQQALKVEMKFVKRGGEAQQFVRILSLYHSPGTRDIKPNLKVEGMVHHRDLAWRWFTVKTTIKIRAHDFLLIACLRWSEFCEGSILQSYCGVGLAVALPLLAYLGCCGSPIAGSPELLLRVAVNPQSQGCSQCKLLHWQCGNHVTGTKEYHHGIEILLPLLLRLLISELILSN